MFHTQQIKLTDSVTDEVKDYLVYLCEQSNKLTNCALYSIRKKHFDVIGHRAYFDKNDLYRSSLKMERVSVSYYDLCEEFKTNPHYLAMGGQQAQQTLKSVVESFNSYNTLLSSFFKGELGFIPKLPNYRKDGLAVVTFPAQAIKFDALGRCQLSISRELAGDIKEAWICSGKGLQDKKIIEVRILPRNRELYAEYVFKVDENVVDYDLDYSQAIGIDPGVNNWLTVVSTLGRSFLIDGKSIKSMNQKYNKDVANLKPDKPQGFWSDELAKVTELRNRQMRDVINKAARFIVNYCLNHRIGNIVFGWGQGVKTKINIGTRNNQNFVQVPTSRLKNRIAQLCSEYQIVFTETEESYTSKTSFIDDDFLPKLGEKPQQWKPSGRRIKRGQYRTANKSLINADCNGAANILRKVKTQLGLDLAKVIKEVLTLPKQYNVFSSLNKKYRNRCEVGGLPRVATSV